MRHILLKLKPRCFGVVALAVYCATGFAPLAVEAQPTGAPATAGVPAPGEAAFRQRCATCHSTTVGENRIGPSLHGVGNRRAGTATGFNYSEAIKQAGSKGLVWTPTTLDPFLADPIQYIRDFLEQPAVRHRMPVRVQDAEIRSAIVSYLTTLTTAAAVGTGPPPSAPSPAPSPPTSPTTAAPASAAPTPAADVAAPSVVTAPTAPTAATPPASTGNSAPSSAGPVVAPVTPAPAPTAPAASAPPAAPPAAAGSAAAAAGATRGEPPTPVPASPLSSAPGASGGTSPAAPAGNLRAN